MTGIKASLGAVTACAFLVTGCGGGPSATTTAAPPTPSKAPVEAPAALAATSTTVALIPLVVTIRNYAFVPQNPVVTKGQSVVIVNSDSVAHTWSAAPRSSWSYDSGNIPPGGRATFPGLSQAGRYPVLCQYHAEMPTMTGTVTVR